MFEPYLRQRLNLLLDWLVSLILIATCAGCFAKADEQQMVAQSSSCPNALRSSTRTGSLLVQPVTGKTSDRSAMMFGADAFMVDNTTLQHAVADSMRSAGMFRQVVTEGPSDYQLGTNIVSASGTPPNLTQRGKWILYINYRLMTARDNKVIWQDDIGSEGTYSVFDVPHQGNSREVAMNGNLAQLVAEICTQVK